MIEFAVLGTMTVTLDGREVAVPSQILRRLLALLLCHPADGLTMDMLADQLWPDTPAPTARRNLHVYIHRLRGALGGDGSVVHRNGRYRLDVAPDQVDAQRFLSWSGQAVSARDGGDLEASVQWWARAVKLWRGATAYADVADLPLIVAERARLQEMRLTAVEERATAELDLRRDHGLVPALAEAVDDNPYRERLLGLFMLALYRNGRQADALDAYRKARARLAGELGIEPGAELQALHQQILRGDPVLAASSPASQPVRAMRFLPGDVAEFSGRAAELAQLDRLLGEKNVAVISAIGGVGGVGKTALAVRWAHSVKESFPDGQLYVNLRGFAPGRPLRPVEALRRLLRCLGAAPQDLPTDLDDAAALYRSLMSGRRILVILDNARTAEQVRPLLPGEPGSTVLVTSRHLLSGLIAHDGARRLTLGVLDDGEALALLRRRLGDRVDADPDGALRLARLCGGLPLALCIAAAHLADHPRMTPGLLAEHLGAAGPVAALTVEGDEDRALRAVLDQSYQALPAAAQHMLRMVGAAFGPDLSLPAAAALAGVTAAQAGAALDVLAGAHLVDRDASGRFSCHDLVRGYATIIATTSAPAEHDQAQARLIAYLDSTARQADAVLVRAPSPGADPSGPDQPPASMAWFEAELATLTAAIASAAAGESARSIAQSLRQYFHFSGRTGEWITVFETVLDPASAALTDDIRYVLLNGLGQAYSRAGYYDQAMDSYLECMRLAEAADDGDLVARTCCNLAVLHERRGDYTQALHDITRALAVFDAADARLLGAALRATALPNVLNRLGRHEEAREHLLTALPVLRELGTPFDAVRVLSNLGATHQMLGLPLRARDHLDEALALCRQIGDRHMEALNLANLSDVHRDLGDLPQAVRLRLRANEMLDRMGIRGAVCEGLNSLADLHVLTGQPGPARQAYEQALALARQIGARQQQDIALAGLTALGAAPS